jgi:hypothetical protein
MSHAVTITRTTHTTTSSSAIIINSGYFKTIPGLLKIAELILAALCVFFVSWNFWSVYTRNTELFFLCVAVACLVGTSCLFLSCLISFSTGGKLFSFIFILISNYCYYLILEGIISKTIYELIYHGTAFVLCLIASILLLMKSNEYRLSGSHPFMISSVK